MYSSIDRFINEFNSRFLITLTECFCFRYLLHPAGLQHFHHSRSCRYSGADGRRMHHRQTRFHSKMIFFKEIIYLLLFFNTYKFSLIDIRVEDVPQSGNGRSV
jgi:hypothetical protein